MITVNERVEECTAKLSMTFVNSNMVSAYSVLTSKKKNFALGLLTAALSPRLCKTVLSCQNQGDTNEMRAAKSEHHLGLNKTSRSAAEHRTRKQTHRGQINILSQMHQYFLDKIAVTRTAVTHFHLCL